MQLEYIQYVYVLKIVGEIYTVEQLQKIGEKMKLIRINRKHIRYYGERKIENIINQILYSDYKVDTLYSQSNTGRIVYAVDESLRTQLRVLKNEKY